MSAPSLRAISAATISYGANTAPIAPPAESIWCVSRPRSATRRRASSSDSMPATHAAAYSPRLWPSTTAGSMPHERHSAASAYSIAKVAGWSVDRVIYRRRHPPARTSPQAVRDRDVPAKSRRAFVERSTEDRRRLVEQPAHSGVLRTLPGEQERDLRPRRCLRSAEPRTAGFGVAGNVRRKSMPQDPGVVAPTTARRCPK